jgi:tetratricopeptide (TPR) repeat protein
MNSIRFSLTLVSLLAALPLAAPSQCIEDPVAPSHGFYAVQIAARETLSAAHALVREFEARGYGPVWILDTETWKHILIGRCEFHLDAFVLKRDLRDSGIVPDAYERWFEWDSGLPPEQSIIPLTPLFEREVTTERFLVPEQLSGRETFERIETLRAEGDDASVRTECEGLLAQVPETDQLAGYAHTRLGILDLLAGEYESALAHLTPVANGQVASDPLSRIKAMRRVAWIDHHDGRPVDAYRRYGELATFAASEEVRARCAVERVGIALEMAESEIGTMNEVRDMARRAWASFEPTERSLLHHRATLEIMFLETFARQREPDYATAARLGEEYIERWQAFGDDAPLRELGAAMFQTGMYHLNMDDPDTAFVFYNRVIEEIPADAPQFNGLNPHCEAMLGLANVAYERGDRWQARLIMQDILRLYPDEEAAEKIREMRPDVLVGMDPPDPRSIEE